MPNPRRCCTPIRDGFARFSSTFCRTRSNSPRALERFGQLDSSLSRKYEGTGLGLPLSKRLMELHGGRLEIESVVGIGTTVTATFPGERLVEDRQAA